MDAPPLDLKTISELSRSITADHAMKPEGERIIFDIPRHVPTTIAKRGRRLYGEIQLEEALAQSKRIGIEEAERISGVPRASIYKYAQRKDQRLRKGRNTQASIRRVRPRYTEASIKAAFARAVQFHLNSGTTHRTRTGITKCIRRAAKDCGINENYLLSLYSNRNPILGFSPGRPDDIIPPQFRSTLG